MRTNQKTSQRNRETKTEVKHMNGRKVDNPYPLIFIKAEGYHTKTTKLISNHDGYTYATYIIYFQAEKGNCKHYIV